MTGIIPLLGAPTRPGRGRAGAPPRRTRASSRRKVTEAVQVRHDLRVLAEPGRRQRRSARRTNRSAQVQGRARSGSVRTMNSDGALRPASRPSTTVPRPSTISAVAGSTPATSFQRLRGAVATSAMTTQRLARRGSLVVEAAVTAGAGLSPRRPRAASPRRWHRLSRHGPESFHARPPKRRTVRAVDSPFGRDAHWSAA